MIVTTGMLKKQYESYANPLDKIRREAESGTIIRIRRGIYETDPNVEPYYLASSILSPSYLSFEFALSFYGLIPERVISITSASLYTRKNKTFVNQFGRYDFSDIPVEAFPEGLTYTGSGEYIVRIATKEKALCDSLYKWRVVHSIKALKELLFEDKRIDEEEFASCDFEQLIRLAKLYHRTNLKLLIGLIEKDYLPGRTNAFQTGKELQLG